VTRKAGLRIIAATNRDLKKRVAGGAFREDLYFRLNVISAEMPPLRARNGDLLRFALHYEQFFARQCGRPAGGLSPAAAACLQAYAWPGNLRELRNVMERAVIMARGDQLSPDDFPGELRGPPAPAAGEPPLQPGAPVSLEKLEEAHLRKVLAQTPNLTTAAEILGIDQATLYRKRKKLGLE
jgi:NtrC-family two-component system response regulator AlgB